MEWIIGVVFAVASCAVSNLGLNLQKLCHNRNNAAEKRGEKVKPYTTQPVWILGFTMVWVGSVLDFVALGFAAQTVIAPLGSLTLVTNVYFAPYFNGEKASRKDLVATAVIVVGSATAVAFGDHSDAELRSSAHSHTYRRSLSLSHSLNDLFRSSGPIALLFILRVCLAMSYLSFYTCFYRLCRKSIYMSIHHPLTSQCQSLYTWTFSCMFSFIFPIHRCTYA